jgi:TetR/AcrR family transcriptional repressor of bet genes
MAKQRDAEAQRIQLSEAVWLTFAELGPGGFTLRAVADRAGCTTGLVLHTFRDKQALLLHARDLLHERTRARAESLEAAHPDPVEALRAVTLGALPTTDEGMAEARVWIGFLAAALSDPVLAERHAANSQAFADRLARLLVAAEPSLDGDAPARGRALAAAVEGITSLAAGDPRTWTTDRQSEALDIALAAAVLDSTYLSPSPGAQERSRTIAVE